MAFRRAEEIESVLRGEGDGERGRFGEADVFAGHAHHAAREVERVFAGFEHAREPVEGRVGIGVAHGLVQRGDEVVVLFAGFVVAQELSLQDVFEEFGREDLGAFFRRGARCERPVPGCCRRRGRRHWRRRRCERGFRRKLRWIHSRIHVPCR